MRRTYRSKKDTAGGTENRDFISKKDSVFEAFFTNNKREPSYVALNSYSSNKVHRRKYVKRLKEPESMRESLSRSTYLTPDKSIHVNKTPDLFDQLLNSSPTVSTELKSSNILNAIQPRVAKRTYCRKKLVKSKKFNYSSNDSTESDKENTTSDESDLSQNTSNIKTHKLLIEKERISSPIYLDESINKIVKKLPILNRLKRQYRRESTHAIDRTSFDNATQSPLLQQSPLCSTPFHEKYRGKSIYKFSPISLNIQNESRNVSPLDENKCDEQNVTDDSIICVEKDDSCISQKSDKSIIFNITNKTTTKIKDSMCVQVLCGPNETERNAQDNADICETVYKNSVNGDMPFSHDTSSLQITEFEPFLGFACNRTTDKGITNESQDNQNISLVDMVDPDTQSIAEQSKCETGSNIPDDVNNYNNSKYSHRDSSDSMTITDSISESLYDTCDSEDISEEYNIKEAVILMERMDDSIFQHYYKKLNDCSIHEEIINSTINENEISSSYESDYASFVDTESSEKISDNDESNEMDTNSHESLTEDLDLDSVHTNISSSDDNIQDSDDTEESGKCISFVTTRRRNEVTNDSFLLVLDNSYSSGSSATLDKTVLSNEMKIAKTELVESNNTLINNSCEITENNEIRLYSEPNTSSDVQELTPKINNISSTRVELTENKEYSNMNTRKSSRLFRGSTNTLKDDCTYDTKQLSNDLNYCDEAAKIVKAEEATNISTRKSSSMSRASTCQINVETLMGKTNRTEHELHCTEKDFTNTSARRSSVLSIPSESSKQHNCELKQGIVLKPGKKWERSLSIYRRMTVMGDDFDRSILDDESMNTKGRKYRQSVISTMEMQDYRGSLHNESIISRRSTFVSKPNRSTIRIVIEPNASRDSLCSSVVYDDLKGFLNEDCDDTVIELSKLSIADSDHEVRVLDKFHESSRVASARDYVLRRCDQTEVILFDECYPDTVLKNCRKIGEGVYGEVYLWRAGDGRARVMKIVPIAGTVRVNGESQKDYAEIISEIVIAMELSALRAPIADIERHFEEGNDAEALDLHSVENATDVFNEVLAVRCVFGNYPSRLLDLWELYDECNGSENDNPAVLPPDQHYIVLELANAGQDLEGYQFGNAEQAYALFVQIAYGLAVAEEAYQFEHRDLHWGNVLIKPTDQKYATFVLRGRLHRVARRGVAATIIDYSLSRVSIPLGAAVEGAGAGVGVERASLYNDLAADEALFDALGDYQFEVYRLMRDKLENDWKNFEPYTNILWLHYTVDKMITALRYQRTNTKIHKHYIAKLKEVKNRVLDYGSAAQFVLTDNEL